MVLSSIRVHFHIRFNSTGVVFAVPFVLMLGDLLSLSTTVELNQREQRQFFCHRRLSGGLGVESWSLGLADTHQRGIAELSGQISKEQMMEN